MQSTQPMRTHLRALCATAVMITAGCGGPNEEHVQRVEAATEALRPHMARITALYEALPAPGEAREFPLTTPIPTDGLETVDKAGLEAILGLPEDPALRRSPFLISDTLQGQSVRHLEPDPDPNWGAVMNAENRVKHLAAVEHVVVFVPTAIDEGEIGAKDGKDSYTITRGARWEGWVHVYAFEDPPRLVAAFPTEATSRDRMTLTVRAGHRPSTDALLEDAHFELRRNTLRRLTQPR